MENQSIGQVVDQLVSDCNIGFLDTLKIIASNPVALVLGSITLVCLFKEILTFCKAIKASIKISAKGIEISPRVEFNTGTPFNTLISIINWIERETMSLTDQIHGIKRRYFKQSKDFTKASIVELRERITQEYFKAFVKKYNLSEDVDMDAIKEPSLTNPSGISKTENTSIYNSLYFFKKCLFCDFNRKIETPIYTLIEENHLVNRSEREYEEEIINLAKSVTAELYTSIFNYPDPIDHGIAVTVYENLLSTLQNAITNALRNSRTISLDKRDVIDAEKAKYISKKTEFIYNIVEVKGGDSETNKKNIIGEERIMKNYL